MNSRAFDTTYNSHADFYRDVYSHAVREVRPAGRTGSLMMLAEQEPGDWSDAPTPDLVIVQSVSVPGQTTLDLGAGHFRLPSMLHASFICIAPGAATKILVDCAHKIRITAIPYRALCVLSGESAALPQNGDFGALHAGLQRDGNIAVVLDRLWTEARTGSPHGALWADGALLQLSAHLLRLKDGYRRPSRGGLASRQLKRVNEYLSAHLTEDVGLAELAAVAGLSPTHFSRAFKQSTGRSPVQELIGLRVGRAKGLLADPSLSVIEVAALCGYDSPSAFAQVFRRATGSTPTDWRRKS